MKREDLLKEIREEWFKNHKPTIEKLNDNLSILTWEDPNSSSYYTKFVLDGSNIYISGDMGEAVFCLTEKAKLENIKDYDIRYFHSKLTAFSDDKYSFSEEKAINRIKEEIKDAKENIEYDEFEKVVDNDYNSSIAKYIKSLRELIKNAEECSYKSHWDYFVNEAYDQLTDYSPDVAEWIYTAGNIIPNRVEGFLLALKMAYEIMEETEARMKPF